MLLGGVYEQKYIMFDLQCLLFLVGSSTLLVGFYMCYQLLRDAEMCFFLFFRSISFYFLQFEPLCLENCDVCIQCFCVSKTTIPDRNNLKEGRLISAPGFSPSHPPTTRNQVLLSGSPHRDGLKLRTDRKWAKTTYPGYTTAVTFNQCPLLKVSRTSQHGDIS